MRTSKFYGLLQDTQLVLQCTHLLCNQGHIIFYHHDIREVLLTNENVNNTLKGLDDSVCVKEEIKQCSNTSPFFKAFPYYMYMYCQFTVWRKPPFIRDFILLHNLKQASNTQNILVPSLLKMVNHVCQPPIIRIAPTISSLLRSCLLQKQISKDVGTRSP